MKTKQIHVKPQINEEAAKAVMIVEEVKKTFDFDGEYEANAESDDKFWCLGWSLKKSGRKNKTNLELLTGKTNWFGWFGFEASSGSGAEFSVWIYCQDKHKAEAVKAKFPEAKLSESGNDGQWDVKIAAAVDQQPQQNDYKWFADVFSRLGLSET